MNVITQNNLEPFESWKNFGVNKETVGDRDSKFLFHYDDDEEPYYSNNYEEAQEFHYDEYEYPKNNIDEDIGYLKEQKPKPKRKKYKTTKPRKKKRKRKKSEMVSDKAYIGQPVKKKIKKGKKKDSDRRESNHDWPMASVMHSMLDFLSNPGDFFANMQSSYAGGQGDYSFGGGGGYNGGGGGSVSGGYGGGSGGAGGGSGSNAAGQGLLDGISGIVGDTSLSRKDFVIELTTWFRRVVWFLAFTSATTVNPGLFLVAAGLALVFELVYNITNARMYWDSVIGYDNVDPHDKGNINYVDDYDKTDNDYDQADYSYQDYPVEYPLSRNIQNRLYPIPAYRPKAFVPSVTQFGLYQARRLLGNPSNIHVPPYRYNTIYRNAWMHNRPWPIRRSGVEPEEDTQKSKSKSSVLNWRYLLGLPPWFLKD